MTQLNSTTWNGYLNLVTLDLTSYGDGLYGFIDTSPYTFDLPERSTVEWQDIEFQPLPFELSGFERSGENKAEPSISVPDFSGDLFVTLLKHGLASGSPVTRYQALAADIESNDPNAPFLIEQYLLRNVSYDTFALELKLATHLDYQNNKFPSHICYRDEFPGLGSNLVDKV